MIDLLAAAMEEKPDAAGFLLDGFPANMSQANLCQERLGNPQKVRKMIF